MQEKSVLFGLDHDGDSTDYNHDDDEEITSSDWKKAVPPVLICQTEANAFIAFFSWMLALLGTEILSTWLSYMFGCFLDKKSNRK